MDKTPRPRRATRVLAPPPGSRLRAVAGGRVLLLRPDGPPTLYEANGEKSVIQMVADGHS